MKRSKIIFSSITLAISLIGLVLVIQFTRNGDQSNIGGTSFDIDGKLMNSAQHIINGNAELAASGFSGNGTSGNPFVIDGEDLGNSSISNTTSYLVIQNCDILSLVLHNCSNVNFTGLFTGLAS